MNPIKLELKNIFSHENSIIEFDSLGAVTLITGKNGAGKSSIFEALVWCLYGNSRADTLSDVVRNGHEEYTASVKFTFESEGVKYLVHREADVKSTKKVELKMYDGGSSRSIASKSKADTQKQIAKIVGTGYDVFYNSVYFKQGHLDNFCQLTATERKKVFEELQGLGNWEMLRDAAKEKESELKSSAMRHEQAINTLSNQIRGTDKAECERLIKEFRGFVNERKNKKVELDKALHGLIQAQLGEQAYQSVKSSYDQLVIQIEASRKRLLGLKSSVTGFKDRKKELVDEIKSLSENISIYKKQIDECDEVSATRILGEWTDKGKGLENKSAENSAGVAPLQEKIREATERLTLLDKGSDCYVCSTKLPEEKKQQIKNELGTTIAQSNEGLENNRILSEKLRQEILTVGERIKDYEKALEDARAAGRNLENCKVQITEKQERVKEVEQQIDTEMTRAVEERQERDGIKKQALDIKAKLELATKPDEELGNKIQDVRSELIEVDSKLSDYIARIAVNEERISEVKSTEKTIAETEEDLRTTRDELLVYAELVRVFGPNGIPFEIMKKALQDLEKETNNVLKELTDDGYLIQFKTFRQNKDKSISTTNELGIEIFDGRRWRKVNTFSGGQQVIISIAIRVGLSEILMRYSNTHFDLIFMDEGLGSLDDEHRDKVINLISYLSNRHRVMVITHMNYLKQHFNDILKVEIIDGVSKVV